MGYVIQRASGELVGPFFTRSAAEHYVAAGDEVVFVNEHGNVIDYGPQFDECHDVDYPQRDEAQTGRQGDA